MEQSSFIQRKSLQEVWMTQRKDEVCTLTCDIMEVMSYGCRQHGSMFYLEKRDQIKDLLPQRMQECIGHIFTR